MKRILCLILSMCIICIAFGCGKKQETVEDPANFYYQSSSVSLLEKKSVLAPEVRDISEFKGNTLNIFNAYLQGPKSDEFISPFPKNLQATAIERTGDTVVITFTEQLTSISGLDMSIACACICSTVTELIGNCDIQIKSSAPFSDGTYDIEISKDQLFFLDKSGQISH